ncbi:TonB family C-terminal domain-containing protein [Mucilaginibacter pineti]|uniref:TonB family C-terminal domain-containing protein n=1 Tax=Mucilaginibacter pineti TaxID=1391627 RepID=A0A1G6TTU8_9SPHI|nr:energy transducer TonB [Mucilaginibacter pineti]SDD32538.1 TonB family C-terminal domain-containing protein [Mucilaginibacter pineti]
MKKIIPITFLTLSSLLVKAQKQDSLNNAAPADSIFRSMEQVPEFPGGTALFYELIATKIRYPKNSMENGVQGKVFVQMTVKSTGELDNIKAIGGPNKELNDEAVRVVKLSPRWKPGMKNGKPITIKYVVPITFALPKDDDKQDEQQPEFLGGNHSFGEFLAMNVRYPQYSRQNRIQGKVILQMIIRDTGKLDSIKVISGPGKELNDEAIRVVKLSPPWKPGMKNGKPVTVRYSFPITFNLD